MILADPPRDPLEKRLEAPTKDELRKRVFAEIERHEPGLDIHHAGRLFQIIHSYGDRSFTCGFAAAISTLIRIFDQPTMARDIAHSNGLHLHDFENAKVEPFDLEPIRKA